MKKDCAPVLPASRPVWRAILERAGARQTVCAMAAATTLTWTTSTLAQGGTTAAVASSPSSPVIAETTTGYAGPNRALLGAGIVTWGVAYIPAVIVAAESPQNADQNLYIPVAGPWIDLGNRPQCGGRVSCDLEGLNKVLLATDGVFQGIGVLAAAAGFVLPERATTIIVGTNDTPSVHLMPAQLGSGALGMTAFGRF
jgi:hypothetical protein